MAVQVALRPGGGGGDQGGQQQLAGGREGYGPEQAGRGLGVEDRHWAADKWLALIVAQYVNSIVAALREVGRVMLRSSLAWAQMGCS